MAERITHVFSCPDLVALLASSSGGAAVSWRQTGVSATLRSVGDKLTEFLNVKDFGAKGDGLTNDYAAIAAAIVAAQARGAGTRVVFPASTTPYLFGTPILIEDTPVFLEGAGMGMGTFGNFPATVGTTLQFTGSGSAGQAAITFRGMQSRGGMSGIALDVDLKAEIGLAVDTVLFGEFSGLQIFDATKKMLLVAASDPAYGSTCSWNEFRNILLNCSNATANATACGIHITGSATTNSAHNTFDNIAINYGSASAAGVHGICLGNCDNNRFFGIYMNRTGGSNGAGVSVIPTELSSFPSNNLFVHLQAGAGGWVQPVGTTNINTVIGYSRDNGEPAPTLNNTPAFFFDSWGRFNALLCGSAGASGAADIRTPFSAQIGTSPNIAQIICGYQGGSDNFHDANIHHFRDGAQANEVTIQALALSGAIPLLRTYTVATVPSAASYARGMIYVSDETGGATVAFSDGTNWRRVQDRAIVS